MATARGHLGSCQLLVNGSFPVHLMDVEEAVLLAAGAGHEKVLDMLLNTLHELHAPADQNKGTHTDSPRQRSFMDYPRHVCNVIRLALRRSLVAGHFKCFNLLVATVESRRISSFVRLCVFSSSALILCLVNIFVLS
jgi:hypothetical protein